jgi:predicted transposase YbfD/YdcC
MGWRQGEKRDKIGNKRKNIVEYFEEAETRQEYKTVRSTCKMESYDSPLPIISTQISELGITFASKSVEGKSNEIPTVQQLIDKLDIRDCLLTADALNCQRETAEAIIRGKGDYLLDAKGVKIGEWHYYISSRTLTSLELLHHARMEWAVESMHWILDVHYSEDFCFQLSLLYSRYSLKLISVGSQAGQQHLKSAEKDIKKAQRIQSGGKALFLDTDPAAKVSILAERQSSFTQHIQVERGHIFTGPGAILVKDNIQTPVQLILYGPMLAYRIGKTFHVSDGREEISGICCSFTTPADRGSHHTGSLQSVPFCPLRQPEQIG